MFVIPKLEFGNSDCALKEAWSRSEKDYFFVSAHRLSRLRDSGKRNGTKREREEREVEKRKGKILQLFCNAGENKLEEVI